MRLSHRLQMLVAISVACFGGTLLHASDQTLPVLDGYSVTNIALRLAGEVTHSRNYSIQGVRFEPSTREWVVQLDAKPDSNPAKSFLARVNESTGLACLEVPPSAGCVIQENIHQVMVRAQERPEAVAITQHLPASDLQDMAEVLLRHQLDADRAQGNRAPRAHYFVNVPASDAKGWVDLSPEIIANLKLAGMDAHPGSAWKQGNGTVSLDMYFLIGYPVRRSDGDFELPYGYHCGPRCAVWFTAVMRRDAAGWHVVSATMNSVS